MLTPEQHAEVMKAMAENRARQKAMEAARRQRERGVELCLVPAPDEAIDSDAFQAELSASSDDLHKTGLKRSQYMMAYDAVDGAGFALPEFAIFLKDLGLPALGIAAGVCGTWVGAKLGRKVRLKIGDVEAEGRSTEEIAKLLVMAKEFQSSEPTKTDDAG